MSPPRIYDLSPAISAGLPVWPGDTAPAREILLDIARGDNLTLSTLRSTVHVGSHADAPSHYGAGAPAIEAMPLELFIGPCRVIRVDAPRATRLGPELIEEPPGTERLLIATGSYPDPSEFNEDFAALSPELVERLADAGVRLVGIDTPSVDLFASKDLPSHKACLRREVAILEGLVLTGVPEGVYELIALPLSLAGFDASPVRAVLREL